MSMGLIRKRFELVLISVSRSFWTLQDRQNVLQKRLQLSVQKPDQVIKEDVSELRSELQRKDALVQKHLTKLRRWQQVLEDINVQHKKPADMPQGSLAFLEKASVNIPAPLKQT